MPAAFSGFSKGLRRLFRHQFLGTPVRAKSWRDTSWRPRRPGWRASRHLVDAEDTREFFAANGQRMPVLQEKFNVPHFDAKGEANNFFARQRVPVTYLYSSGYWENLIHFGMGPQRGPDGKLAITFPTGGARVPWIGVEDIGIAAPGIPARRCAQSESIGGR
jgi:hypothetical protein